mgnify:CR=1 FL=1
MKKCPVCGKEWSDATRFCGSCGAKLEDGNIVVPDIVPDDGKEEQRKRAGQTECEKNDRTCQTENEGNSRK